jgi:hypothetical protein
LVDNAFLSAKFALAITKSVSARAKFVRPSTRIVTDKVFAAKYTDLKDAASLAVQAHGFDVTA